jgi:hypothetical protein
MERRIEAHALITYVTTALENAGIDHESLSPPVFSDLVHIYLECGEDIMIEYARQRSSLIGKIGLQIKHHPIRSAVITIALAIGAYVAHVYNKEGIKSDQQPMIHKVQDE